VASYSVFLLLSGVFFTLAERIWPRKPQPLLRPGYALDLIYAVFNAEVAGSLVAIWLGRIFGAGFQNWREPLGLLALARQPEWVQLLALLLVKDFLQWNVHFTLHRVPALWEFHKVHHSSEVMDWLSNWRFHWLEIVVYQTVLYLPANLLGISPVVTFGCAVVSTTVGHFAHANVRLNVGPLKYLINSPEMHLWHHVHPDFGPVNKNFAISIALWDWLFHTAYAPAQAPKRLGIIDTKVT
jgi:sterol desaturase/sphingolipid hydroxylase (fatty acid hydroxylase superfamily)